MPSLVDTDIRDAIEEALAQQRRTRGWLAQRVAERIECNPEVVMRYLRKETRSSILGIPDACLTVLKLKIVPRGRS